MSRIAGIIYPSAFQVTEVIEEMDAVFPSPSSFHYLHHKNLELGAWGTEISANETKDIWGFLDGDIYNRKELCEELKKLGFKFNSDQDSELIVHAYDAWKEAFLKRLNGPFALAIFDERKEMLLLARDRIGQKPLYWTAQGEYWLFSTELKGLIATGIVPQAPSISALSAYLYLGFIPQDLSAIHGVNKLLPCHYLKVNLHRQSMIGQYWSLSDHLETKNPLTKEEAYDQLGKRLEDAVRISLPETGIIGSFLEDNLGSAAMTWFLSHLTSRTRIRTYSSGFDQDLQTSSEIANALSLTHESTSLQFEKMIDELPKMIWYLDEPVADPLIAQTWHLGKLASSECSFIYADLGWEEMLGGNPRYFIAKDKKEHAKTSLAFFLAQLSPTLRDWFLLPILKFVRSDYLYRILRNIDINKEQVTYLTQTALFKGKERRKVSPMLYEFFNPEVFTQRFHRLSTLPGNINPTLYYDAKTELPDRLLIQFERLLAPHNLHVINPFLDYRLVEFLAELPETIKFESQTPGALLHHLMERLCHHCPPFLNKHPSFIESERINGRIRDLFSLLLKGRLVDEGMISGRWIRQQLGYPYLIPKTFKQLWTILVLEVWFRLYISRPIDLKNSTLSLEELLSR